MAITRNDLPESPSNGLILYCAACDGQFSACRGDYFWLDRDVPLTCSGEDYDLHEPVEMVLARKVTSIVVVKE